MFPQSSYAAALGSHVTIFGDKVFEELIKVKWGRKGGVVIQSDWSSYRKRKRHQGYMHREKAQGPREKVAICKPRGETRRNQSGWYLDLELPASRTVSRYIFLAQSFQSAVFCFGSSTKCGLTMYVSFKKDGSHRFMNLLLLRLICFHFPKNMDFPGSSVVNNLHSIPGPGRSPGGGNGNPI